MQPLAAEMRYRAVRVDIKEAVTADVDHYAFFLAL